MAGKLLPALKRTFSQFIEDDCMMMASSLAYYTIFSLPPLMYMSVAAAGWIFGPQAVEREVMGQIRTVIGPGVAQEIQTMLRYTAQQTDEGGWTLIVGLGALMFAATGVFVQLQAALNRTWNVRADPDAGGVRNFVGKRLTSIGMLLGVAFLMIVSLIVSAILSAASHLAAGMLPPMLTSGAMRALSLGVNIAVFTAIFATILRFLPDAEIEWKDVWAGALATSLLFELGKEALGWYMGRGELGQQFGASGSLAVVMLWSYYAAMILLLGAEFTEAWAWANGHKIMPEPGAIKIERRELRDYSVAARS